MPGAGHRTGRTVALLAASSILVIAAAAFATGAAPSARPATARPACLDPADSTVPADRLALLRRGFNLTSWLDGPETRVPDFAVLATLHARGFTHIRLPVTPERLMPAFSPAGDIARDSAELDRALDALLGMGYAVSLDLHPGPGLGALEKSDPSRAVDLVTALWSGLAARYATRSPDRLFFEVLNEPSFPAAVWAEAGPRLVAAIRAAAPDHTIVYDPADDQRIEPLFDRPPIATPDVVYAVHYYDPMVFTHQGLDWSDDPLRELAGVPFPARLTDPAVVGQLAWLAASGHEAAAAELTDALAAPWDEARIAAAIGKAGAWSAENRVPVIVNEFGVLAWKAPPADRVRWLTAVAGAATASCLGWALWDYADGFGFVSRVDGREIPDEAILAALLGLQS